MSAVRWLARRHAPSPIPVAIHTCPTDTPHERAETVAFLDDADPAPCHFVREDGKERSHPCPGESCPFCLNGTFPLVVNHYAPGLLHRHGNRTPDGRPVWERVVYYISEKGIEWFHAGNLKGKQFKVWREKRGSVKQFRARFDAMVRFAEPPFDVKPFMEHHFTKTADTSRLVQLIGSHFPPVIIPPSAIPAADDGAPPTREALNRLRAANGKPPLTEAEWLKVAKDSFTFKGESIAERQANGTYAPGKPEGGAE